MPLSLTQPYGINLPIRRGESGYFEQTYDIVDQVNVNLMTLFRTKKGERRMSSFGSDIYNAVFEFNNDDLTPILTSIIKRDIQKWMPYIEVNDIIIDSSLANRDIYRVDISINFTIESLGVTDLQTTKISINYPAV